MNAFMFVFFRWNCTIVFIIVLKIIVNHTTIIISSVIFNSIKTHSLLNFRNNIDYNNKY